MKKRTINYIALGLWSFGLFWFIVSLKANIVDMLFTIVLIVELYLIIKLWEV